MPEQFDYPKEGWSTGKMRTARRAMPSDPGYPIRELESERKRRETKVSEYQALTPEQWNGWQTAMPQGQIIDKDHVDSVRLADTHDLWEIPDKQYEKFLFMNPKARG